MMHLLFLSLLVVLHLLEALPADVLAFDLNDIGGVVAEDACGLILAKDDIVSFYEDLYWISILKIECGTKLFGNYDPSELVQLPDYACSLHFIPLIMNE